MSARLAYWGMLATFALIVLVLFGCASVPSGPAPIATSTKTVTADIAVSVPCILPEDVPKIPVCPTVADDATTYQKVAALSACKKGLDRYAELVDKLFLQCTKTGVTP